tara:strand:- start:47 stop:829 length:783 start_codon:yes stop_codon:yes gene_type:complete
MDRKLILTTLCLALLTACGGSNDGTAINPTSLRVLWESPRGTGAGLVRAKNNEANGVAIVDDVNDAGSYAPVTLVEVISEQRNSDESYSGEVVVRSADGTLINIIGRFYDVARLYASTSDANTYNIVADGSLATNMPIGSYSYTGYAESYYMFGNQEYEENGSFVLNAQFAANKAQLTANTDESRYFNNNLTIGDDGEITGSNGTFIVFSSGSKQTELERRVVDFDGTFHGSGATHVSGIAIGGSSTDDNLSVIGILGKR